MKKRWTYLAATCLVLPVYAAEVVVPMHMVNEQGIAQAVGQVTISESAHGLVLTPQLSGLPSGVHGFHVHENGSCAAGLRDGKSVPALAAGGHYDPLGSKRHGTPWGDGHLGDLPGLVVDHHG